MAKIVEETIIVEQQPALTQEAKDFMKSAASWAKFLAILNYVCSVILVLAGIIYLFVPRGVGMGMMGGSGATLAIFYILIGLVNFYIAFMLYKFATDSQRSIALGDTPLMTSAMLALKRYFKIFGIFTIVVIALVIVAFVIMAVSMASMM